MFVPSREYRFQSERIIKYDEIDEYGVADLEVVETSEQDVRDLLTVMKLDALKWILEPSNGTGAMAAATKAGRGSVCVDGPRRSASMLAKPARMRRMSPPMAGLGKPRSSCT